MTNQIEFQVKTPPSLTAAPSKGRHASDHLCMSRLPVTLLAERVSANGAFTYRRGTDLGQGAITCDPTTRPSEPPP